MIIRLQPDIPIKMTRTDAALLSRYLAEASYREKSDYLSGWLDYLSNRVFTGLEQHSSVLQFDHALENAEALLTDIQERGDPWFWEPPRIQWEDPNDA